MERWSQKELGGGTATSSGKKAQAWSPIIIKDESDIEQAPPSPCAKKKKKRKRTASPKQLENVFQPGSYLRQDRPNEGALALQQKRNWNPRYQPPSTESTQVTDAVAGSTAQDSALGVFSQVVMQRRDSDGRSQPRVTTSPGGPPDRAEAPPSSQPDARSGHSSDDTSSDSSDDSSEEEEEARPKRRRSAEREHITQLLAENKALKRSRTKKLKALKGARDEQIKSLRSNHKLRVKALRVTHRRKLAEVETELAEVKEEASGLRSQIDFYERFLMEGAGISEVDLGTSRIRVEDGISTVRRAFLLVSDLKRH